MAKTIYVVFTTHYDIGFTGLPSEVVAGYRGEMLDRVLALCRSTADAPAGQRFVWTLKSWPLAQSLDPARTDPDRLATARTMIERGQLRWTATPFTTHTEFCGLEEYVRGLYISRRLSETFGYRPADAKTTDVPGHTWFLPGILADAGVQFIQMGSNPASMPPAVPRLFYWEGADHTRLLTMYTPGGYGSALLPPPDWPHDAWLALLQTGDNHGPQHPGIVAEILARVQKEAPDWNVVIGTLADFGQAILAENPPLPVVRGDMADSWIHGVGTMPRAVAQVRQVRGQIAAYEMLSTLLTLHGRSLPSDFRRVVAAAYEQSLLFGDHTWGLDCKLNIFPRVYEPSAFAAARQTAPYQRMEQSWREKAAYVQNATDLVAPRLQALLAELAAGVNLDGPRAVAFNPLGWEVASPFGGPPLPPMGWRAYPLQSAAPLAEPMRPRTAGADGSLENEYLHVTVDRVTGTLSSLLDKRTGHQWCAPGAGQYVYEVFSRREIAEFVRAYGYDFYDWYVHDFGKNEYPQEVRHRTLSPHSFTLQAQEESLLLEAPLHSPHAETSGAGALLQVQITLSPGAPHLDITYTLKGKVATPLAEAGWFSFPLELPGATFRLGKTGSVVDPQRDILPDCNTDLYCVDNWVDVSDGQVGMTVISPDIPLVSIGQRGIYKFSRDYRPTEPTLWWNAFNNAWGTNFPQWHEGDFTFRFRLVPHAGDWRAALVWQPAREAAMAPLVAYADGPGGSLPTAASVAERLSPGLVPLAFKPAEDGAVYILRLWEASGCSGSVEVQPALPLGAVERTNLLEYGASPTDLQFPSRPYQVHTLRLRPAFAMANKM